MNSENRTFTRSNRKPRGPSSRSLRCRRSRRGTTLVEALIAGLLSLIVGGALIKLVSTTYTSRSTVIGENTAFRDTRTCLDVLSNAMLNAQMVSGQGVFSAAGSNAVTCYTSTTGTTTTRYWLDTSTSPGTLKKTDASGTTVLLADVQSLQFTYYVSSSANFTSTAAQWSTTSNKNVPSAAEIPNIGAVGIDVTINSNGYQRTLSTLIRLRNSPAKTHI